MNQYLKHRDSINSGDPILFSGRGAFSTVIKLATMSPWSHVGMAVLSRDVDQSKHPELRCLPDDTVLLLESVAMDTKVEDLIEGKGIKGVRIVRLSDKIMEYGGDMIAHVPLRADREGFAELFDEFIDKHHGKPYEQNHLQLLQSAVDILDLDIFERQQDTSSLFCSELVAEFFFGMGWMDPQNQASNEYVPADFSKGGDFNVDGRFACRLMKPSIIRI